MMTIIYFLLLQGVTFWKSRKVVHHATDDDDDVVVEDSSGVSLTSSRDRASKGVHDIYVFF